MFSSNKEMITFIVVGVIALALVIIIAVFLWRRALGNGASINQVMVGKKIGELCTSDAMCGTNKCRLNVCVI
jgi:hypothetical protein